MKRNGNHTNIMQDKKTKIKHALHLREKSKTKSNWKEDNNYGKQRQSNTGIIVIPKVENPIDGTENVLNGIIQEMKELICTERIHCVPENDN